MLNFYWKRLGLVCGIAGILLISFIAFQWPTPSSTATAIELHNPAPLLPVTFSTTISTTVHDFALPGTPAGTLTEIGNDPIVAPSGCIMCHINYGVEHDTPTEYETVRAWQGSMMALSARDPLFWAALDVANADANDAGEFCLRCHVPKAWLEGRSQPTDGSALTPDDYEGVQCEVCHRLVDPVYEPENPDRDQDVLAALTHPVLTPSSGSMIVDPLDERRGPFRLQDDWTENPHSVLGLDWPLPSPYHQESLLCATCHDIVNPVFTWNPTSGEYEPNNLDQPGDVATAFPIERTYSEWALSAYNSAEGIYAPQFGGNKTSVSTCQDCHMRDVTAAAGAVPWNSGSVLRNDMPLHDLTGANTWVPLAILEHPDPLISSFSELEEDAILAGVERARYMLQNAATVQAIKMDNELRVTVFNETGHKLPTGYPEGRRMWLQVEGYDASGALVYTSGAYIDETADLIQDDDLVLYGIELGLTDNWATQTGLPAGPSFHFALNNMVVSDNRIPPRGYNFDAFNAVGAAPFTDGMADPTRYANGQYWDTSIYTLPASVEYGTVRLLYQTASKEYIEFLRDNNPSVDPNNRGQILYDLWEQTGKSTPEIMAEAYFGYNIFVPAILRP